MKVQVLNNQNLDFIIDIKKDMIISESNTGSFKDLWSVKSHRYNVMAMSIILSFSVFVFWIMPFYITTIKANFFILNIGNELGYLVGDLIAFAILVKVDLFKALFIF